MMKESSFNDSSEMRNKKSGSSDAAFETTEKVNDYSHDGDKEVAGTNLSSEKRK